MEIDKNWTIRRSLGFELEKLESAYVIVNSDGDLVIEFNDTSALIWQLVDDQRTIGEIIILLQDLYPEAKDVIPEESEVAIKILLERDIIYALA